MRPEDWLLLSGFATGLGLGFIGGGVVGCCITNYFRFGKRRR